jgi:hypothetical protein
MIITLTDETTSGEISCKVSDSDQTVSVPKGLLANFHASDSAQLAAVRQSSVSVSDSNASVGLVTGFEVPGAATFK